MVIKMIIIERENLCLTWDLNLRSPVLRTGVLAFRPLKHINKLRNRPLSYSYFSPQDSLNVILYYNILIGNNLTSGYFVLLYSLY